MRPLTWGRALPGAGFIAVALLMVPDAAGASTLERAIVGVTLNGTDEGDHHVLLADDAAWLEADSFAPLGLPDPGGPTQTVNDKTYVPLASLGADLQWQLDPQDLVLRLTATPELLGSVVRDVRPGPPAGMVVSRDTSAFLNYAVDWHSERGYGVIGEAGLSLKGALLLTTISRTRDTVVRGLTSVTIDDRRRMVRWVAGDAVADAGVLGGAALLGGLSITRDFGIDPYFVHQPTLRLRGAAATPSTADVYVGGQLVRSERLPPGTFELQGVAVPAGRGDVRVVVRDAFGREQELRSSFHVTESALAPGLHEYGYHLGHQRRRVDSASWDYGPLAFVGRHRTGLTDAITVGARLEASKGLLSGGPRLTARLPFGELDLAVGASRREGVGGSAAALAFMSPGRRVTLGGSIAYHTDGYATVGQEPGADRPRLDLSASLNVPLGSRGSLGLRHSQSERWEEGPQARTSVQASAQIGGRASIEVGGARVREDGRRSHELVVGLSMFLGPRTNASMNYERRGAQVTGSTTLQRSLPVGHGVGYRLGAQAGEQSWVGGNLQYRGSYGQYTLARDAGGGSRGTGASIAGGLVAIGGRAYATAPVHDAFALVRVPGVGGVRAYLSNQEVGRTDRKGDLLVTNLLSYYGNRVGIADRDVPLDRNLEANELTVAPALRGGALITFPARRMSRISGTVMLAGGGVPAYGQLTVLADGRRLESPIGEAGEFYLEDLPTGRHLAVLEYAGASCRLALEVREAKQAVVELGAVSCEPVTEAR